MKRTVEVALLSPNTLRIKGKKASLVVDPQTKMPKTAADAVILLGEAGDLARIEESRLVVKDDGEYEVGSIKITADRKDSGLLYQLIVDGQKIILGNASTLMKTVGTANEAEIAILNVDSSLDEALIASLEAKSVLLYGEKAEEGLRALGKNDLAPAKKFTTARESSPEGETQIIWLA